MKYLCLFFLGFSISLGFSQKQVELKNCEKLEVKYSKNDSTFIYSINNVSALKVVINVRNDETFVPDDTLHRDYIKTYSEQLILDRLTGLLQSDYTGAYDFLECFRLGNSNQSYYILSFTDSFIFGTNGQVYYVIMETLGDNWKYYSSYENEADKTTDNIKVVCSKKGLKLKGKYLKQIKTVRP